MAIKMEAPLHKQWSFLDSRICPWKRHPRPVLVTVYEEQLQDYIRDELYKAGVQSRSMIYPFKAKFEDLAQDSPGDSFSGPIYLFVFNTDDLSGVLVLTCHWDDGVFKNDSYVVGAICLEDELKQLIDGLAC